MVLGIDADDDGETAPALAYRKRHVYPYLKRRGFKLLLCQGNDDTRDRVSKRALRPGVVFVTGVGHGLPYTYFGQASEPIFTVSFYDPKEPADKIVHFFSCFTARHLGPDFVRNKCRAYFSYAGMFAFTTALQSVFFRCDSEIDRAIADGLPAAAVARRARALYARSIRRLYARGECRAAAQLEHDLSVLRDPTSGLSWGQKSASLRPQRRPRRAASRRRSPSRAKPTAR
jgi:hypothetical protein